MLNIPLWGHVLTRCLLKVFDENKDGTVDEAELKVRSQTGSRVGPPTGSDGRNDGHNMLLSLHLPDGAVRCTICSAMAAPTTLRT